MWNWNKRLFRPVGLALVAGMTVSLSACFNSAPTEKDIERLIRARYDRNQEYVLSKVSITDLNCSSREGKFHCEYTQELQGTYKKPVFNKKTGGFDFQETPWEGKRKSSKTLSKGNQDWIEELW